MSIEFSAGQWDELWRILVKNWRQTQTIKSAEKSLTNACSNCGHAGGSTKFYPECGTPAKPARPSCKNCGCQPETATKFCPDCGTKMI